MFIQTLTNNISLLNGRVFIMAKPQEPPYNAGLWHNIHPPNNNIQ